MPHANWLASKSKYPIGAKVEGVIKKVWQFGILIGLRAGCHGIPRIRNRELSWEQPVAENATDFCP